MADIAVTFPFQYYYCCRGCRKKERKKTDWLWLSILLLHLGCSMMSTYVLTHGCGIISHTNNSLTCTSWQRQLKDAVDQWIRKWKNVTDHKTENEKIFECCKINLTPIRMEGPLKQKKCSSATSSFVLLMFAFPNCVVILSMATTVLCFWFALYSIFSYMCLFHITVNMLSRIFCSRFYWIQETLLECSSALHKL